MDSLEVAVVQTTSVDDVDSNMMMLESLLEAIPQSVRLICLPENALYMRLVEGEAVSSIPLSHSAFERLAQIAQQRNAFLHVGSAPILLDDGYLYNSSVIISPSGEIKPSYQKMHLFDIQLEGQAALRESDNFRHGQKPTTFEVDGWKIAESICYDIRFSELYAHYGRQEVDVILIPAAFLVKTGQAHWEVLQRARAIENQCYVLAAAQCGIHIGHRGGVRETYGHSMIIDPWGQTLEVRPEGVGVMIATLRKDAIHRVRKQIPMKFHRRIPIAPLK